MGLLGDASTFFFFAASVISASKQKQGNYKEKPKTERAKVGQKRAKKLIDQGLGSWTYVVPFLSSE